MKKALLFCEHNSLPCLFRERTPAPPCPPALGGSSCPSNSSPASASPSLAHVYPWIDDASFLVPGDIMVAINDPDDDGDRLVAHPQTPPQSWEARLAPWIQACEEMDAKRREGL